MNRRGPFRTAAPLILVGAMGCFPTLQTPEVRSGFRLASGVVAIADQERNGEPQGGDYIPYAAPSYGFGEEVEIGVPIGVYLEEGLDSGTGERELVVLPYLKASVLHSGPSRLALVGQTTLFAPASLGAIYGYDTGRWLPYASVRYIFTPGPAGDDPVVTRFQEKGQRMVAIAAGARLPGSLGLALEGGVLINSYQEGAVHGDFGQPTTRRTLADFFLSLGIGF